MHILFITFTHTDVDRPCVELNLYTECLTCILFVRTCLLFHLFYRTLRSEIKWTEN